MRLLMLAAALLLLPAQASALCRCTCVRGVMKPICQETDLVVPICQGLCELTIQTERAVRPLAGGRVVNGPPESTNPSPGGLQGTDLDLNTNPNGQALGTPSQLSGSVGSSLDSGGSSSSSGSGAGGR